MTVGRNDPCPCGSGKKYKKCCLEKQAGTVINISDAQLFSAENELISKLVAFGNRGKLLAQQEIAFKEFFAVAEDAPQTFWTKDKEISFMGWFTFDYRLPEGKRVIDLFAECKGNTLSSLEEQLLQGWLPTASGLYEVQEVERGRGIFLQEIFTKECYFVHDVSSSRTVSKWTILLARIIPVGDIWHFAGYLTSFYPQDKDNLIALGKKELRKLKKKYPRAGWLELFLDRVAVFFQYAFQKQINPPIPQLTNYDGDNIEMWTAVYRCRDIERVRDLLRAAPDFESAETKRGSSRTTFIWVTGVDDRPLKSGFPGESILLGQVTVKNDKAVLEVNSRQRLEQGKNLLQEICGSLLEHRVDSMIDGDALVKKAYEDFRQNPSPDSRPQIEPEIEQQIVEQLMTEYYRRWLNEPVPALGGKTPRQAVKTKTGREKVRQLLKEIEFDQDIARSKGRPAFDLAEIKRELGLE